MAKCPICNSKKGQRQCLKVGGVVCSLCCGITRNAESCLGCTYYQKPKRLYGEVPAYTTQQMDGNQELESYGNVIEGALCTYDIETGEILKDSDAVRVIEALIDLHYFKDYQQSCDSPIIADAVAYVEKAIEDDLQEISNQIIVKILGVIRFVAKRRDKGGRDYWNIIHQYVGLRIGNGIGLMQRF